MSSVRTKLPHGVSKALDDAAGGLRTFTEGEWATFNGMSENWRASDRGRFIADWLDSLEEVSEALDECRDSADC